MSFEYDQQNNSLRDTETSKVYFLKSGITDIDKDSGQLIYCGYAIGLVGVGPDTIDYIYAWDKYGDLIAQLKSQCDLTNEEDLCLEETFKYFLHYFNKDYVKCLKILNG